MALTHVLTGFVIHSRPYQEKRALYTFFCRDAGLIDGVGVRGLPLFTPMNLMMSGKGTLKNFKDPFFLTQTQPYHARLPLALQYAALYLNELIYKLLPKDDPQAQLWQCYHQTLTLFELGCEQWLMRCALRRFEQVLFSALGVALFFDKDSTHASIDAMSHYLYHSELGFVPVIISSLPNYQKSKVLSGQVLLMMHQLSCQLNQALDVIAQMPIDESSLKQLSIFYRQIIDELLEFKPLNSRKLWQDQNRLAKLSLVD